MRRASAVILAGGLLIGGCGGGEKSDSEQARDTATHYMEAYANKKLDECRKLVTQPQLCGDLGPLAERVNSQAKSVQVAGRSDEEAAGEDDGAGPSHVVALRVVGKAAA